MGRHGLPHVHAPLNFGKRHAACTIAWITADILVNWTFSNRIGQIGMTMQKDAFENVVGNTSSILSRFHSVQWHTI